ncbi:MAG: hypothetical protein WAW96_11025 [Alphaproteobacteria bacterium]
MTIAAPLDHDRYAKCIAVSKRVAWDIDKDAIRGRTLDVRDTFLPPSLTKADRLDFLNEADKRLMSQVQGRTYANIFGLVERYINAKILEVTRDHWFGDQLALETLVRFSNEELKHQELFRRVDKMCADVMPVGYRFLPDPNEVAHAVLSKSTWSVLGLTCFIEIFVLSHARQSIETQAVISPLFKDIFLYHARDEVQHIVADEIEWQRVHDQMSAEEIDRAVDDLIALVAAVDGILVMQSAADVEYFADAASQRFSATEYQRLKAGVLDAYRWQYIVSGVGEARFMEQLGGKLNPTQLERVSTALAPFLS